MKRIIGYLRGENGKMLISTGVSIGFAAMTIVVALFVIAGGLSAGAMLL